MGKGSSSSKSTNDTYITDNTKAYNFENVGKAVMGTDNSVTTTNYNLASNEAMSGLSQALTQQASQTTAAVKEQKNTTNEIVNSLQSAAKTNATMITVGVVAIAGVAAIVLLKRR